MKNARPNTKDLGILKQISYFEHLNIEELSDIAMNMEVKYFGSYETIKIKNDILYIVNNGALKLLHKTQTGRCNNFYVCFCLFVSCPYFPMM